MNLNDLRDGCIIKSYNEREREREVIKQGEPSTIEEKLGIRELKDCIGLSG